LADLLARHRRNPAAPAIAAFAAEAAFQAGLWEQALELLAKAVALRPDAARHARLARQLVVAFNGIGQGEFAHRAFELLKEPSEAFRLRHLCSLLEQGTLIEAAATIAGQLREAESVRRAFKLAARARPRHPDALHVLIALARTGRVEVSALYRLIGALAQAGASSDARCLLARTSFTGPAEAALCEAVLLRGEGALDAARQRIAPFLAVESPNRELLFAAHDWAWEALDLDHATTIAERILQLGVSPDTLSFTVLLAKLLAEQGRQEASWKAVTTLRFGLRQAIANETGLARRHAKDAFRVSLDILDLEAASGLSARVRGDARFGEAFENVMQLVASSSPDGRLAQRAVAAWADPEAALRRALDSDVVIISPQRLQRPLIESLSMDAGPSLFEDRRVCHHVLATALYAAEQAGLRVEVLPSPGNVVPAEIIQRGIFFVSYHSFSLSGSGVHVKGGPLHGTVLIDSGGYSGWTSICSLEWADLPLSAIPGDLAGAWVARERVRLSEENRSKYDQRQRGTAALPSGPAVLVALQVADDNALRHRWVDMFELARRVVAGFRSSGVTVIVKRHPKCRDPRTDALLRELGGESHVMVSDASIHDLLEKVSAVYCVNSGLGAEALLYGVAVHVGGNVDYRHVCHEVRDLDAMRFGQGAFRPRRAPDDLDRYLYWYRNIHHVPLDQPGALDAAVAERIIARARAARQLR
jgi:hypothetical protein